MGLGNKFDVFAGEANSLVSVNINMPTDTLVMAHYITIITTFSIFTMSLISLPAEILCLIADECSANTTSQFLRTCRRFHNLLKPRLYRHHANEKVLNWGITHRNLRTLTHIFEHGTTID